MIPRLTPNPAVPVGRWPILRLLLLLIGLGLTRTAAADDAIPAGTAGTRLPWAFRPRRTAPLPAVGDKAWPQSPIDNYILERLEIHRLKPSDPADRRTLIRRASYDLTGLPPTPEAIGQFVADRSPDAFARVVDRLLASPAYGERWGRHWLDVVRYADARDLIQLPAESDFREAWRYRDWVVRAHNSDLPFNEFVRYQVAGDLLQPDRADAINEDGLVATGLLALADFVPGDVDKDRMIADYVNDQIDVVGRAFLGLTVACARCHDHKFDPITMEDYYGLAGIFFSTRLIPGPVKGNTPLVRVPLLCRAELDRLAQLRQRAGELEIERQQLDREREEEYFAGMERLAKEQSGRYLLALAEFRRAAGTSDDTRLEAFASARGLDPRFFVRWARRVEAGSKATNAPATFTNVPGWNTLLKSAAEGTGDAAAMERAARELESFLAGLGPKEPPSGTSVPGKNGISQSEICRLRAGDSRMGVSPEGRVTHWPNRVRGRRNLATPVSGIAGPVSTNVVIGGHARPVLRFSGSESMEIGLTVPPAGSLFAVFKRADRNAAGQRLVGWEDSDSGRHGLGLMLTAGGGLHAILRADGVAGDIVAGVTTNEAFEIVGITWGPGGSTLRRQGQREGANTGITQVSPDPAIKALKIGGPGSGASARFAGDIAELRIYDAPLDDIAVAGIEGELMETWSGASDIPLAPSNPGERLLEELTSRDGPFWVPEDQRDPLISNSLKTRLQKVGDALAASKAGIPAEIPQAVVVQDGGPADTRHAGFKDASLYIRGDPKRPGKPIPRGFPSAIAGGVQPLAASLTNQSGRRQLADWLTAPDNPLTARVAVNRIWQHHFGEGLVRTPTNFGARGERPTHPELLDYLAGRFVESGGSTKAMHRLLMLSATYQQGSAIPPDAAAVDPENRLLSHMNRHRLEAEAIRDTLLAVAGRLTPSPGGMAVQDLSAPCRSLHLMAVRTGTKTGFSSLFDAPDCGAIVDRRTVSTIAPQALFLMNDTFTAEQARHLAARVRRALAKDPPDDLLREVYRQVFGRVPTAGEIAIGQDLLRSATEGDSLERYCQVLFGTNEFIYID